jgi:NAD(P)-dependent dehydrogenase (short-subunit alcohol dehydrogenase family)
MSAIITSSLFQTQPLKNKYVLVTGRIVLLLVSSCFFHKPLLFEIPGAAHRLGAEIATTFHRAGATVAIHYRSSKDATEYLLKELNQKRPDSAFAFQADLQNVNEIAAMVKAVLAQFNDQLDILVNNASTFYSTPFGSITVAQYDDLMGQQFSRTSLPHASVRAGAQEIERQHNQHGRHQLNDTAGAFSRLLRSKGGTDDAHKMLCY